MKKSILMSVGLSTLLLSSPVLAKTNHINLNVSPITGNQTSVNGKTVKLATVKVLHNKTLVGKSVASKNGTFKVSLKTPVKNGWKYTVQVTKKGFTPNKYTVTALYASTKTVQAQNNDYQNEIHDLQNNIVSLQSQLNDLKNKTQQATTTVITEPSNNTNNGSNSGSSNDDPIPTANQKKIADLQNQIADIDNQLSQISTKLSGLDPYTDDTDNPNNDIPTQGKLMYYKRETETSPAETINDMKEGVSKDKEQVASDENELKPLTVNSDNYYIVLAKLESDKSELTSSTSALNYYEKISEEINSLGENGYLKEAMQDKEKYDELQAKADNLSKKRESLYAQIDELTD